MKVRFLTNCVADKKTFYIGDIADISEKDARFLIVTKRVEPIKEEEKPELAVKEFIGQGIDSPTREAEIKKEAKKKVK